MTEKHKNSVRIFAIMMGSLLLFGGLIGRLYYLQIVNPSEYVKDGNRARTYYLPLLPTRGLIEDRNGRPLALNANLYTIVADEVRMESIEESIHRIGALLGQSEKEQKQHIAALNDPKIIGREIARNITEERKQEIEEKEIPGIAFKEQPIRLYPEGDLAAHLIGYTGTGNVGRAGLEFSLNEKMKGTPHKILTKYTIKGRSRKPLADVDYTKIITRGADVVLTIDSYMQFVVERELAKVRKQFKAIYANAVVLHPKSGEILAMANSPSFDPNHYSDYAGELRKNRLLVDVYEPGSVIKPFTVIAALDQRVVTPEMKFYCEKGRFYFHGRTIRDDIHRFEDLSVHDILVRSSNIGTVKIAQRLAPNDWRRQSALLYDYLRRFGFKHRGEKTLPVLPGETGGILRHPREWMPASIGAVPYGQEIATNSVTLAAAYAAIANRGVYQPPQIIKGYKTEDRLFYPRQPRDSYRIVRRDVVEEVVEMMVDVTEDPEGTGTNVRIPGYSVAGKTGTAQIPDPVHGGYKRGSRIASFAGFFPARDPQAVIVVMVEEPQNGKYGGEVAGPAWKAIAEELVAYWGISPTVPNDPLFVKAQEERGRSKVEQMKAEMDRERTFGVTKMLRVPEDRDPNADLTTMPNLIGLPIRQAYIALAKRGLTATFAGSGKIASQPIPAGTPIEQKGHIGKVECTAMLTDPNVADPSNTLVTLN